MNNQEKKIKHINSEAAYRFILDDKEKLVKLFAFIQGWQNAWLISQQESSERLYERKFELIDIAVDCTVYKSYPVDEHNCLDHEFLQAFFAHFPDIEVIQRPDLTFVSKAVVPKMIENYRNEEAWKHHAQVLVLKKPKERIEYLYSYVPEHLKKKLEEMRENRSKRINDIIARHD